MHNVLHITDPHLFTARDGELRGTVTYDSLSRVLAHVRASGWQADCIALTGDLVQDDRATSYQHFPALLKQFDLPVLCVPGNHDNPTVMREKLSATPFHYCASLRLGAWQLVGLDSTLPGQAGGQLGADEIHRLKVLIAGEAAEHVVVCLHHPPVLTDSAWLDSVGLANADETIDTLRSLPTVRAVLSGHVHQHIDVRRGALRVISTPSTCSQFAPGAETFALDDRPPAYRRITLNDTGELESDLIWIDA